MQGLFTSDYYQSQFNMFLSYRHVLSIKEPYTILFQPKLEIKCQRFYRTKVLLNIADHFGVI